MILRDESAVLQLELWSSVSGGPSRADADSVGALFCGAVARCPQNFSGAPG